MKFIVFLVFFIYSIGCMGQENKLLEFIGTLQTTDGTIMTYKITFKKTNNDKVEGVSITDFNKPDCTKSKIEGHLKGKHLSFKETANVSTKSTAQANEFCYIHVKNATIKMVKGKSIIQGSFKGMYANDSSCANGYLYLIGTDFLNEPNTPTDSLKSTIDNKTQKEQIVTALKKTEENQLSTNDVLKIKWVSEKIVLELWDAEKVDNDRITIFVNDKKIVDDFLITREKKIIVIPFDGDLCSIKIYADNEGEYPPNTAHIILKDREDNTAIVTNLKKGELSSIVLEKMKK